MITWLRRSFDIRLIVIAALLVSDAGHTGYLFSVREASDRTFIGYLLAFCLDAASGIALYDMVNARHRGRRLFASSVFAFAAVVAGGFSLAYYRGVYPADEVWTSVLMASVAPVLAGMLSVMRAFGHVERAEGEQVEHEAARALELEKHRVVEQERTRCAVLTAREQTKQVRAQARAESAKTDAIARAAEVAQIAEVNAQEAQPKAQPLALPAFTHRQLAQIERVVAVHAANETATLRDLRLAGVIGSDTTASRARQRAITGGYLVETAVGFSPNGRGGEVALS